MTRKPDMRSWLSQLFRRKKTKESRAVGRPEQEITDEWNTYFYNVNGHLASIFLNLGLRHNAPIPSKTSLLWAWVYFRFPRPDGLSDSSEAPTLFAIEDSLSLHVGSACDALLCGRITTLGRREFYFYGKSAEKFATAVETALSDFPSYKVSIGNQQDPLWKQYFDVLFPSKEMLQSMGNRDVLENMAGQNDKHAVPRRVEHWIYFKSEQERVTFRDQAIGAGFAIAAEYLTPELALAICVAKIQPIDQESIDESVLTLFRLGEQCGGEYDGWEAQVMTG